MGGTDGVIPNPGTRDLAAMLRDAASGGSSWFETAARGGLLTMR
jgi:hypothetical protein